jgi:hypothetical protein
MIRSRGLFLRPADGFERNEIVGYENVNIIRRPVLNFIRTNPSNVSYG